MGQISNIISTKKIHASFRGIVEDSTYLDKQEDRYSFASHVQYQHRMFH